MGAGLSLDFLAVFWLLSRSLGVARGPAALGAFLFGFGSARMAAGNSPQLIPMYWGVLALMALLRAFDPAVGRRAGAGFVHASDALDTVAPVLPLELEHALEPIQLGQPCSAAALLGCD